MRKSTILPVMALGALTLGTLATTLPAGASVQHSVRAGEDGSNGTTTPTVPSSSGSSSGSGSGSGSGSTPSGGASTGGGGMAGNPTSGSNVAVWLVAGGAGLALIGTGAFARRRRTLDDGLATSSSVTTSA